MDFRRAKHISFDVWLTLIKSNPVFKVKRNRLLAGLFEISSGPEQVNATIRKFDTLFNRMSEISGYHVKQSHMWMIILDNLGCDVENITGKQIEEFNTLTRKLFFEYSPVLIDEKSEKLFSRISEEGISISLLSNTGFIEGHIIRELFSSWGIEKYFAFQLYSDETGYAKPGLKAFESLYMNVQQIKMAGKSDILHIGDNKKADVEGALRFGLSAALLSANEKISTLITD